MASNCHTKLGRCSDANEPIKFVDLAAQQRQIRGALDHAIKRVMDHGQYIMGPEVALLESQLIAFTGARHAITCASGTDGLLIALMAFGVGRGDAVMCPAFTYTATPEAIALLGATPVFVDVDADTYNLTVASLETGLITARSYGLRPVGAVAVDLFGLPADYESLEPFARKNQLFLLCDAAQSFGATLNGRSVGTFGHVTATSFFPSKPLGCYGDGGAIFTMDDKLAARMSSIRLHGKAPGDDKYAIERIRINSRLDTIQAAILIEKLTIFKDELQRRRTIARYYTENLRGVVEVPREGGAACSAWAQYTITVPSRDNVSAHLNSNGIPTAVYYPRPLHLQTAYREYPIANTGLPVSEELSRRVLSLPIHSYLSREQQAWIVEEVQEAVARYVSSDDRRMTL